ncbi:predicted protein [Histoplasma capsulatum G186AR]|uniref:Uncharacterized protein n=1 Tax=Ajellomyces capsulatus (strain G186AR / H82 / ATCC MYA-2454 / RMSCC 2432) TaxID=447093 RepID=C0NG54_AJECG|nr:uncharacterized protein HCBG_01870 [Histoplasma capsulatum G186AR]EEH10225.1 predicted protein [Histoplasma capsulatum G186AR]
MPAAAWRLLEGGADVSDPIFRYLDPMNLTSATVDLRHNGGRKKRKKSYLDFDLKERGLKWKLDRKKLVTICCFKRFNSHDEAADAITGVANLFPGRICSKAPGILKGKVESVFVIQKVNGHVGEGGDVNLLREFSGYCKHSSGWSDGAMKENGREMGEMQEGKVEKRHKCGKTSYA